MKSALRTLTLITGILVAGTSQAASSQVIATCQTLSRDLDSSFAIYDVDAKHFRLEWTGSDHPVEGYSPIFSETVKKRTVLRMDTGGEVIAEDPQRVKIEIDLRTGKGRMRYYKWQGYQCSLFSSTADLKLEAEVVCRMR